MNPKYQPNQQIVLIKALGNLKKLLDTTWICHSSLDEVGFLCTKNNKRLVFNQKDFWTHNAFPSPALS